MARSWQLAVSENLFTALYYRKNVICITQSNSNIADYGEKQRDGALGRQSGMCDPSGRGVVAAGEGR